MKERLLTIIFCKWLKWHWLDYGEIWVFNGKAHRPCKLCHKAIR